jgi:hypothetical protein
MHTKSSIFKAALAATLLAGGVGVATAADHKVTLSGDQEVPAVTTSASGSGTITVNADKTVSGSVTTKGLTGTMAHIHMAPPGKAGPPVITLTKSADGNSWAVPAGAKLTDEQYESYKSGNLYINVHSDAHKPGEIRGQIK